MISLSKNKWEDKFDVCYYLIIDLIIYGIIFIMIKYKIFYCNL